MLMREWWAWSSWSDSIEMTVPSSEPAAADSIGRLGRDSDLHQFQYYRTRTSGLCNSGGNRVRGETVNVIECSAH